MYKKQLCSENIQMDVNTKIVTKLWQKCLKHKIVMYYRSNNFDILLPLNFSNK